MNSGTYELRLRIYAGFAQSASASRYWHACMRVMLLLALFVVAAGSAHSQAIQVIANPSIPVAELSQLELRAIYTSRLKRWKDGTEIKVFVLPQTDPLHQQFCKSVLEALPHQLQAVWNRMVYSGMGHAPIEVPSEQEMLTLVSKTPGAIGYTGNANDVSNVQVIRIEELR